MLVLIEVKPSLLRKFRPINLCNVVFKLVSKVIVRRLRGVWGEIINPTQASFVPGRQSINNVVICQELKHTLRFTKAKRGGTVIKLDLEKAYDRMEWNFIEETLGDASQPAKFVEVIMNIVSSNSC